MSTKDDFHPKSFRLAQANTETSSTGDVVEQIDMYLTESGNPKTRAAYESLLNTPFIVFDADGSPNVTSIKNETIRLAREGERNQKRITQVLTYLLLAAAEAFRTTPTQEEGSGME